MACRTGCPTQDHATWGECARASNTKIAYCNSAAGKDATAQKKWDNEIKEYRSAVAQGIRPNGTTQKHVRAAVDHSQRTGTAFTGA
jgi:hypothetical protein